MPSSPVTFCLLIASLVTHIPFCSSSRPNPQPCTDRLQLDWHALISCRKLLRSAVLARSQSLTPSFHLELPRPDSRGKRKGVLAVQFPTINSQPQAMHQRPPAISNIGSYPVLESWQQLADGRYAGVARGKFGSGVERVTTSMATGQWQQAGWGEACTRALPDSWSGMSQKVLSGCHRATLR